MGQGDSVCCNLITYVNQIGQLSYRQQQILDNFILFMCSDHDLKGIPIEAVFSPSSHIFGTAVISFSCQFVRTL